MYATLYDKKNHPLKDDLLLCLVKLSGDGRVCNRLSGYSGYSDIHKNLSVRIAV